MHGNDSFGDSALNLRAWNVRLLHARGRYVRAEFDKNILDSVCSKLWMLASGFPALEMNERTGFHQGPALKGL